MIESELATLKHRYNAECDVVPGTPMVTWADMTLTTCIERLADRLWKLEQRVIELEANDG